MSFKRAKVVRLSTNQRAKENQIILFENSLIVATRRRFGNKFFDAINHQYITAKSQHLYFTTNDTIKEGDYGIYNDHITQFTKDQGYWCYIDEFGGFCDDAIDISRYKKIVASTDPSFNLPQPSKAFIKKYCEKGGINEVMIEFEEMYSEIGDIESIGWFVKVNKNNEITIKPIQTSFTKEDLKAAYKAACDNKTHAFLNKDIKDFEEWFNNKF